MFLTGSGQGPVAVSHDLMAYSGLNCKYIVAIVSYYMQPLCNCCFVHFNSSSDVVVVIL